MGRSPSPPANDRPPRAPFHSHPSDLELVESYLRPWVDSGLQAGSFIHVSDVYAAGPATLARDFAPADAQDGERAWYFLTPLRRKSERGKRKVRTVATGEGWWHNEAKSKPVIDALDGRRHVGYRQSFSFMTKEGGQKTRAGWIMLELSLDYDGEDLAESLVLCKVYRSPRHPGDPASPKTPTGGKWVADVDEKSSASPQLKEKTGDDVGSSASLASAATVAAPRKAEGEIPDMAAAAAGRKKEEAAVDDDSAQTTAVAPRSKRKAADDASSVAASAAEPPRSKRKTEGGSSRDPATERELHCPQCGCHLDVEALLAAANSKTEIKPETGIIHVQGDSVVKDHSLHQFL